MSDPKQAFESTTDITDSFSEPFYLGSGAQPDEWAMPVSIDGRGFIVDLQSEQFSRRSVDLLNTQDAQSGRQNASVPPEVWRRSMESWHQGADQLRYDREDSLPYRYSRSVGIDPWKRYGFQLLHETKSIQALGVGAEAKLESIGRTLMVAVGTLGFHYPDVIDDDTDFTQTPFAANIVDTTADGENFYVLTADGVIHRCVAATGVWSTWGTVTALVPAKAMIAFVKGFIIVGNGPILFDYTSPANPVKVYQHRLAGWHWRSACEGLTVIYVLGGMGDRWHLHRVDIKPSGADLNPPIVAASLPEGEVGHVVASYLGYVLIGVSTGWRFGMPDQSGAVTYGQLVETPAAVRCFEGQDRFVWFGLSLNQGQAQQGRVIERTIYIDHAGVGRADLSTFVAPMTPAAASDLRGRGVGVTTDVVSVGNEADGIGWRVFAIAGAGVAGAVYIETDTLVPEGTLATGTLSFNSNDQKVGLYAQAFHEPLRGRIVVRAAYDKDLTFTEIGNNDRVDSVTVGNMPYPVLFNATELEVTLFRDATDPKVGPRMARVEFRAMNVPGRSTEWRIPLIVHEDTNYANIERARDVRADYDFLMELVQSRRAFVYREGDRQWRLHATDFLWQPYKQTYDGATFQGTYILVARELV